MLDQHPRLKVAERADTVLAPESGVDTGYRFSWGLAIVGGVSATAITFFLLTLGSGFGLMLVNPLSSANPSGFNFLTGGAIYFFVAQAFGFAVGGHLAGRLLGPIVESNVQETFRAVAHGLMAWCVAILATLTMIGLIGASAAGNGATIAALYTFQASKSDTNSPLAYWVDTLFRPEISATGTPSSDLTQNDEAQNASAHAEAGRILSTALLQAEPMQSADQDRLAVLSAKSAGISTDKALVRIVALESDIRAKAVITAEKVRRAARDASLWLAASMLFGALVSMLSAVFARIEDDRESLAGSFYGRAIRARPQVQTN